MSVQNYNTKNNSSVDDEKQKKLFVLCNELDMETKNLLQDGNKLLRDIFELNKKHKISNILKHIIDLPQS